MEWLLGDGYFLSANIDYRLTRAITFDPTVGSGSKFEYRWGELEYPLKRAITFDLTVGSHSNFYKGF